jgi:RNA polymerase sigma factor (sigma-70 family)
MEINNYKAKTLESWVKLYNKDLYVWALRKTNSKELSEDMVQETFLSAFNSFEKFQNKSHPKTWLIAILNNSIIDYYRKEKRIHFHSYDNLEDVLHINNIINYKNLLDDDNQEVLTQNVQLELSIGKYLKELPEKWNKALTYRYLNGETSKEICMKLQITNANYWQIVHRAKSHLRMKIEKKLVFD